MAKSRATASLEHLDCVSGVPAHKPAAMMGNGTPESHQRGHGNRNCSYGRLDFVEEVLASKFPAEMDMDIGHSPDTNSQVPAPKSSA